MKLHIVGRCSPSTWRLCVMFFLFFFHENQYAFFLFDILLAKQRERGLVVQVDDDFRLQLVGCRYRRYTVAARINLMRSNLPPFVFPIKSCEVLRPIYLSSLRPKTVGIFLMPAVSKTPGKLSGLA